MPPEQETQVIPSGEGDAVKEQPNGDRVMEPDQNNGDELTALRAEMAELKAENAEMLDRLQVQSRAIGKLTNATKREQKEQGQEPGDVQTKPQGDVSKYRELEEKLDQFQKSVEKKERAAKLSALELALVDSGADPKRAKSYVDFLAYRLGDRMAYEEDDAGRPDIRIVDTDGESFVSVSDWAKAFVESDDGAVIRATKKGPSVPGNIGEANHKQEKAKLNALDYSRQYAKARALGKDAEAAFIAAYSMQ